MILKRGRYKNHQFPSIRIYLFYILDFDDHAETLLESKLNFNRFKYNRDDF